MGIKHIAITELLDQKDIVGDLLSNIVWNYKTDFLVEANVLINNIYSCTGYECIKKFINSCFGDINLDDLSEEEEYKIINNQILNWCGKNQNIPDEFEFLEVLFTKVLNDIISNILNTDGGIDSFILDYKDIVDSVEESDISKILLLYFHNFIKTQIDLVKNGWYEINNVYNHIDMSKYGIETSNDIKIPRHIEKTYITLIRNPKLKPLLNKELIVNGTDDYSLLNDYLSNIKELEYKKLIAFYIKDCEYHRVDMYKTYLGDIKIVKKNTY
jgi:hypothetical protein